jgi:hypothetical protein
VKGKSKRTAVPGLHGVLDGLLVLLMSPQHLFHGFDQNLSLPSGLRRQQSN